ncbi:endonuclease/exonuclease/phosphatase family protein [Candidatus Omnitrophota bacterium]
MVPQARLRKSITIRGLCESFFVTVGGSFRASFVLSCVFTVTGFLGKFGFLLDLTSHFRVHYLLVQFFYLVFGIVRRSKKFIFTSFVFFVINLVLIIPWYLPVASGPSVKQKISILLINVNTQNRNFQDTVDYISKVNPDILALEEINEEWLSQLEPIREMYPFSKIKTREDNFGIALFSKMALINPQVRYFEVEVPSIVAKIKLEEAAVSIVFTHPVPPADRHYYLHRNRQLRSIAASRDEFGDKLIVIGDLNTTNWSYHYQAFLSKMRLQDTRKGFGMQPSWPTQMPILLIPIDHCLVSSDFVTLERKIGPNLGSDHYPVYVELGI